MTALFCACIKPINAVPYCLLDINILVCDEYKNTKKGFTELQKTAKKRRKKPRLVFPFSCSWKGLPDCQLKKLKWYVKRRKISKNNNKKTCCQNLGNENKQLWIWKYLEPCGSCFFVLLTEQWKLGMLY